MLSISGQRWWLTPTGCPSPGPAAGVQVLRRNPFDRGDFMIMIMIMIIILKRTMYSS